MIQLFVALLFFKYTRLSINYIIIHVSDGEGFWEKMTEENDEAGGRKEKSYSANINSNKGNLTVEVKLTPLEA